MRQWPQRVRGYSGDASSVDRAIGVQVMACLDHATGTVLAQVAVDGKTNEITMLASLLDQIPDLDGTLISMDALRGAVVRNCQFWAVPCG